MLARLYGKTDGVLVSSGQAAIQLALQILGIGRGDEVVVPDECCHLVPAAVVMAGATPVFAHVGRELTLTPDAVSSAITDQTRAVLAVHHLGLPCDISAIKASLPDSISLIEDAAQGFGISSGGGAVGSESDLVVSSFGERKPLSFGGGGGLFGNTSEIRLLGDREGASARNSSVVPHGFPIHPKAVEGLEEAIGKATQRVAIRRQDVSDMLPEVAGIGFLPWTPREGDLPSWHRLPLWASDAQSSEHVESGLASGALQRSHGIQTKDLPMFTRYRRTAPANGTGEPLLVRVDNRDAVLSWRQTFTSHALRTVRSEF